MKFETEIKLQFRDLFPGPEYAKEWERERRLEAALQEKKEVEERSKRFWQWLCVQTKTLTVVRDLQ